MESKKPHLQVVPNPPANVIDLGEAKKKREFAEVSEFVEDILKFSENKFVDFLAKAYLEFEKKGDSKRAELVVKSGLKTKMNHLHSLVQKKIDVLRR